MQGFLQSIANFYADETVYIFETSSQLLRIPKLPIRMDPEFFIRKNIIAFRQLALGINTDFKPSNDFPETLLLKIDDQFTLSPWGDLVWIQAKNDIYSKELLSPPIDKIRYTKAFEKDVVNLEKDRKILVNQRIDQLTLFLLKKENPRSLDFKQIKGNAISTSTHEIDAWSDKDARRIFGHFEEDTFILDRLDQGLH